jgi:c-di-GMP-binding flagellar brake protein YcgR
MQFGEVAEDYDIARDKPKPEMHEGMANDLSAGGVCFVSNHEMEINSRVKCVLPIGDDFFTLGIVMHRQNMRDAIYKYQYRVMFMDLTALEKDKIVKYIFAEQRKVLRKAK